MSDQRTALVTGASTGFGGVTAALLARAGYRVFGTSRNQQSNPAGDVEMLILDVRSDESVRSCVQRLLARADRIDLLINNAGRIHASVIEETSLDVARDVVETNFWGVVRVTNAVLPVMRRQRAGRIINVSSLAGLMGTPGQAFYSASKFALEGYTETLSTEVAPFNIMVTLVEPGFFRTSLHQSMEHGTVRIDDYDALREKLEKALDAAIEHGDEPRKVAEAIVRIARTKAPRLRYRVGRDSIWVPRLKMILPDEMFRRGTRKRFNM